MNVAELLLRSSRVFPHAPAIYRGGELLLTYGQLAQRAKKIAGYLRKGLGLDAGERVGVCMTNCPEYLEVLYGSWLGGLVAVPINAKLHPSEVRFILENSGASVLFVSAELHEAVVAMVAGAALNIEVVCPSDGEFDARVRASVLAHTEPRGPDDVAWLFYTSGTTGRPKGVMLTHRNLLTMCACYFTDVDNVAAHDTAIYAAPFSHGAGLYNFVYVLAGARHVVPASGGFNAAEVVELAALHRNASMFAAPTLVKRMVDYVAETDVDISGIKTVVYGGGPMYLEGIERALSVMGDRFVQIYGQGESPMTITALGRPHLNDRHHPGS